MILSKGSQTAPVTVPTSGTWSTGRGTTCPATGSCRMRARNLNKVISFYMCVRVCACVCFCVCNLTKLTAVKII